MGFRNLTPAQAPTFPWKGRVKTKLMLQLLVILDIIGPMIALYFFILGISHMIKPDDGHRRTYGFKKIAVAFLFLLPLPVTFVLFSYFGNVLHINF